MFDQIITNAAWVTVYNYNGEGLFAGFAITLETANDEWLVRLSIDSNNTFGANGINTLTLEANNGYGFDDDTSRNLCKVLGLEARTDTIRLEFPYFPCKFSSNVKLEIRRNTGKGTKKFKAGLVLIQKGL